MVHTPTHKQRIMTVSLWLTLSITKYNCHLYLYYSFRILVIYPQVMTNELVKIT
jgi:hypothetical protein